MDSIKEDQVDNYYFILKPLGWFPKLLSLQADVIYNCIVFLTSPLFSILSMASDTFHRAEKSAEATLETAVYSVPFKITHVSVTMLKKVAFGILGAVHVGMVLVMLLLVAAVLGVGLVQMWVEEPVFVRERLFFDYTDANPHALFSVGDVRVGGGITSISKRQIGVPVGHTYKVSLVLLMPESEYNREIGVFQLTAEVLSISGNVIAKCSQPCILRFRSLPIRLTRTFLMGMPLLLGITDETQKITINILKHKEGNQRTVTIRVILSPRAGTSFLPQLYEAEILLKSQLPWAKQLVHNWKWTFYVWSSIYIYITLVTFLICCCKPLLFPVTAGNNFQHHVVESVERDLTPEEEELKEPRKWSRDDKEISESLRKWQLRRKRKAIFLCEEQSVASSATSMKITREETSTIVGEEIGDSESICS